jgi:hypothetical protein
MNSGGDIALGYSASNSTNPSVFPSVFYTGRRAGDPPGQMTLGEGSIVNGTGSQTSSQRWGDYTALDVDPTDDNTFWYINEYVPVTSGVGWRLRIGAFSLAPTVTSAVSRKTHTGVGDFDIALPLTGTPGIECRTGGATNDYTMVVTFTGNVTLTGTPQAEVIVGTGCVGTGGVCMGGNNVTVSGAVVTIPLTNVTDDQTINVRLNGVNSAADVPAVDVVIPMTRITGDTNASGTVSSGDIAQTKGRIGQAVTAANFRSDVNASGGINAGDIAIVKQNLP